MNINTKNSIPDIAAMLASSAAEVARYLLPNGTMIGKHWCVGSVDGEVGQSLKVNVQGNNLGYWKDFAGNDNEQGDLVELWSRARGVVKKIALQEINAYLGISCSKPSSLRIVADEIPDKPVLAVKPISREYHQALKSNLAKSDEAMAYLRGEKRGLELPTINHFGLGLSSAYKRADGLVTSDALVAPMRSLSNEIFLNKSAYICVPNLSQNPLDKNGWMKGVPQSYYSDVLQRQRILFVCEGLKDVWRHWQALSEADMTDQILLISSTHGSAFPSEWKSNQFWKPWDRIYLGHDNDNAGNKIVERLLEFIGREVHRIEVPMELGKDWTDFWQNGGTIEDFRILLDEAPVASGATVESQNAPQDEVRRIGRFSHTPVDINGAYVNGHLYYPAETHVIKKDEESGQIVERLETIVIRSDRTVHRATYAPAPPGTPLHQRVLKLTDGTVIEKEPRVGKNRTWDYESIQRYLNQKSATRHLNSIVVDVIEVLRQSIWLPYDEDYIALALTVPVTFLQSVFKSVPLLLLNGPAGSGKSQTGNVMARLCANGTVIGQVSAASAARLIDETRGFVVLDDVESIAAKAGKDVQVNELVQALKVSYNKHTAVKYWTDVKTMKTERLDFFGVKLLSNTLGADAILGSRMIRIQTRKMPEGMQSTVRDFSPEDLVRLRALRNELHTWAFQEVTKVEAAYKKVHANKTDRQAEIAAPLRTMASLIGDTAITNQLEAALARQHIQERNVNDDPVVTLKEAVQNLIKQGFDTVTLTHIRLEMRALFDDNYGMSNLSEIPEWDRPEWLGRQLRSNDLVADQNLGRKRVYGKNLRLVRFSDWVVKELQATHDENGNPVYKTPWKEPEEFCQGCHSCSYRNAGCELRDIRQKEEARSAHALN